MVEEPKFIEYFITILSQIKVFHWKTTEYSKHEALNGLYNSLDGLVDKIVEVYLGLTNSKPKAFMIAIKANSDVSKIDRYLETERDNIRKLQSQFKDHTEVQSLLDDMLSAFNTSIYLCRMK